MFVNKLISMSLDLSIYNIIWYIYIFSDKKKVYMYQGLCKYVNKFIIYQILIFVIYLKYN